ncbi:unnamed protein product [Dibothriocephalus latus]|uniref:SOS1/NGEF-like PH domain-containing protein n=1 Tax=Dibothriocephalus latus TaxID=60516 RepID=A0A3P6Q293_DIBLA|nr:unnamed protein product [Dibothriocephalus latus]
MPVSALGDVIVQDQFTVWEPKQLIKKGRERRVFLFDFCLVLAKECPVAPGDHKMNLFVSRASPNIYASALRSPVPPYSV